MKHYDFRLNGQVVGTFELSEKPGWIHQTATFIVDGVEQVNRYAVRLDQQVPLSARGSGGEWWEVPTGAYPSAAWPLVLRLGLREFPQLDEGSGEVRPAELHLEAGLLVEYVAGKPNRKFQVAEDGRVSYIHWGGDAESFLLEPDEE